MSDDDLRARYAEYQAKSAKADEITDPVEREAAHRRILHESVEYARAETREEMSNFQAAVAKYFENFADHSLYLMLDADSTFTREGVTFSRLYGCRIVAFEDQPYEQIAAALAEDEDSGLVYYFDVS
jgi:hypothetical protein